MKRAIVLISLIASVACFGASTDWGDISVWDPTFDWSGVKWGKFEMTIRGLPGGGVRQDLLACVEDGWLLIYAQLVIAVTSSMEDVFAVTFNTEPYMESEHQTWTVANAGDIVNYDTTHNLNSSQYLIHIDPANPSDNKVGPSTLTMAKEDSVYLAFTSNEQRGDPPSSAYYGWVQLGIDTDGNIVVLNSACDFDHGPMIVGGGAWEGGTPEPASGLLLLVGGALLALRRQMSFTPCCSCTQRPASSRS